MNGLVKSDGFSQSHLVSKAKIRLFGSSCRFCCELSKSKIGIGVAYFKIKTHPGIPGFISAVFYRKEQRAIPVNGNYVSDDGS
jgi:hypothetical protein